MTFNIKEVTTSKEAQAIMPQVNKFHNSLSKFKINNSETYLEAGDKIKLAKDRIKQIKKIEKGFLDPINELRARTKAFFSPPIERLEAIIRILGAGMADWRNKQLEKERIAREKAEAKAREKERLEKERLRKEAEAKAVAARKAEQEAIIARKKAENLAKKENFEKSERARLESERKAAEAKKLKDKAKEIKQEVKEVEVQPREVKTKAKKIEGLHFRRCWKARIVDQSKLPRNFLKPDEVAINEYVSRLKEKASIPGVEVYFEDRPIGG